MNALELRNVTKRFGEKVIANNHVNLTVRRGEILAVLGTAAVIYLICCLIDLIRLQLFKILHIRKILDSFEERIRMRISR